jgi:hypothetical protein
LTLYPWYIEPLPMVFWHPTHGILNPLPMAFLPPYSREALTISGTYPWSFWPQIFYSGQPSHGGDRETFEVMTST